MKMEKNNPSSDAYQWTYERFIKDDPEIKEYLKDVRVKAELSSQIYSIRTRLHMSREELAEFSGLTSEAIEDLEESDYDGSWEDAVELINRAFQLWFASVILPVARMSPEEYSIKAVNA
jgi:DNA-binding XRE family transcriptional regulator